MKTTTTTKIIIMKCRERKSFLNFGIIKSLFVNKLAKYESMVAYE
jgi:hypothetical protein